VCILGLQSISDTIQLKGQDVKFHTTCSGIKNKQRLKSGAGIAMRACKQNIMGKAKNSQKWTQIWYRSM